jgi:hypothetical protein
MENIHRVLITVEIDNLNIEIDNVEEIVPI